MPRAARTFVVVVAATLAMGCAKVLSIDDVTYADASSASGFPYDDGFETPGPGCGHAWSGSNAQLSLVSNAHSGSWACQACSDYDVRTGAQSFHLVAAPGLPNPAPGAYLASAWIKQTPPAIDGTVYFQISAQDSGGNTIGVANNGQSPPSDWVQVTASGDLPAGALSITYGFETYGAGCFLVDDVHFQLAK
jgi:hypothetical protein